MSNLGKVLGLSVFLLANSANAYFENFNMEQFGMKHSKVLSLTFDDGPTPGVTNKILDTLKKHNIKATFFIIASKVKRHPELVNRMVDEGHVVANHSLTHENIGHFGWLTRKKKARKEVFGAHDLLTEYTMNQKRNYFRAPYGSWSKKVAKYLNKDERSRDYVGPILWDIGGDMKEQNGEAIRAADWACWSKKWPVDKCLQGYMNHTHDEGGGVVLMHDLVSRSAQLLEKFIPAAEAKGYSFVSLEEVDF